MLIQNSTGSCFSEVLRRDLADGKSVVPRDSIKLILLTYRVGIVRRCCGAALSQCVTIISKPDIVVPGVGTNRIQKFKMY